MKGVFMRRVLVRYDDPDKKKVLILIGDNIVGTFKKGEFPMYIGIGFIKLLNELIEENKKNMFVDYVDGEFIVKEKV